MCKDKTFSIQIIAKGVEKSQIQVPVFGHHKCVLNSIWFHQDGINNNPSDIIRLNSPQFRLKYSSGVSYGALGELTSNLSSQPYPVFLTKPDAQVGGINGTVEWDYNFQGTVELQLENLTGVMHIDDICIITINLIPIHE